MYSFIQSNITYVNNKQHTAQVIYFIFNTCTCIGFLIKRKTYMQMLRCNNPEGNEHTITITNVASFFLSQRSYNITIDIYIYIYPLAFQRIPETGKRKLWRQTPEIYPVWVCHLTAQSNMTPFSIIKEWKALLLKAICKHF